MFIYLSGNIDSVTDFETFKSIERELIHKGHRINNVVDISASDDITYKKNRMKNVIKADKLLLIKGWEKSKDALQECELAKYIGIPVEEFDDKN